MARLILEANHDENLGRDEFNISSGTIFKLGHFYQFFFGFVLLTSGQALSVEVLILKSRVIVSLAYEVPGTEQKDLHLFVDKLKR